MMSLLLSTLSAMISIQTGIILFCHNRLNNLCTNPNLTTADIPSHVTEIGNGAFLDCKSLKRVKIPNYVTKINTASFQHCESLTRVEIPKSVTLIDNLAFSACTGLTRVDIPSTVTKIGNYAFADCPNLTIYGKSGSQAEVYARANKIKFKAQ